MISQDKLQIRRRNMWQLWILIAVFAMPLIAAWLFYFNPQWLPQGRTNNGTLIDPPRGMESLVLQTRERGNFDWNLMRDKWTLTILTEGRCDDQCIEQLIKARQIRRALGADRERVERLLILLPDAAGNLELPSLDGLGGTSLAVATMAKKPAIRDVFSADERGIEKSLFIIDPRVDLMMVHDMSHITSKQILQDLEKLLKASQSWAKGGQYGHN